MTHKKLQKGDFIKSYKSGDNGSVSALSQYLKHVCTNFTMSRGDRGQ